MKVEEILGGIRFADGEVERLARLLHESLRRSIVAPPELPGERRRYREWAELSEEERHGCRESARFLLAHGFKLLGPADALGSGEPDF